MKANELTKIKDLLRYEKRMPFLKQMDLFAVEDGMVIGVTGSLGMGFKLEGRDLLLQSNDEIEDFEMKARKFWNSLPESLNLHFIVKSESDSTDVLRTFSESEIDQSDLFKTVLHAKQKSLAEKPLIRRSVYVFVVVRPDSKSIRASLMPDLSIAFGKKAKRLSAEEFLRLKSRLLERFRDIKLGLQDLGFKVSDLRDEDILKYLYELLNPGYCQEVLPFEYDSFKKNSKGPTDESLRSRLSMAPPLVDDRFIYLSRYFHEVLNLRLLPDVTNLKAMKGFERGLGTDYLLSFSIEVPDQDRERASLKRSLNFTKAQAFYSRTKDYDASARAGESDEFLTEITNKQDKLFYVSLSVLIKDRSRETLEKRAQEILRTFPKLGDARGIEDHLNHDRLFLSFLPLQGQDNPLSYLVRSEALTHLVPWQASWKGSAKGIPLKTYCEEPLVLDLFDPKLQAKHALMLGTTGSGKSFFTTHLLLYFFLSSKQHDVTVIDVGGSYRKLCNILGGSYLEVECSEKYALNPFPRKSVLFPDGLQADATFLQFLRDLMQRMIHSGSWTSSDKMILERAIRFVYDGLNRDETPILQDVQNVLRNYSFGDEVDRQKAYRFSKELSLFTEGDYGKLLNRASTFDIDSRFTVFDLRKIAQYRELQEIFLFIIPFALKRKFENVAVKKILVLDECWQLLREKAGEDLVEVFYRTARKMNAGVLSITQNPGDFLRSEVSGVIINNSPIKYILRLHKGHEDLKRFGLNENEIEAIRELEVRPGQYAETFIKFDQDPVIAKLEPTPLDYWIATTDPADCVLEDQARQQNPKWNFYEILKYLAQKFPKGARISASSGNAETI